MKPQRNAELDEFKMHKHLQGRVHSKQNIAIAYANIYISNQSQMKEWCSSDLQKIIIIGKLILKVQEAKLKSKRTLTYMNKQSNMLDCGLDIATG